jgi:hypothetical protein
MNPKRITKVKCEVRGVKCELFRTSHIALRILHLGVLGFFYSIHFRGIVYDVL